MNAQLDFDFLFLEIGIGFQFVPVVLFLALVPLAVGLLLGSIVAVIRLFQVAVVDKILTFAVLFLRGVPVVLQLTILYLLVLLCVQPIANMFHLGWSAKDVSYTAVAVVGLSINATVYLSEVVRTALQAVPVAQYEAAYSVGMTWWQMLRRIVIPQALPIALPLIGNNVIGLIKNSSVASLISVMEILSAVVYKANANYKFLEAYLAAAFVYWTLCTSAEWIVFYLENRIGARYQQRGQQQ